MSTPTAPAFSAIDVPPKAGPEDQPMPGMPELPPVAPDPTKPDAAPKRPTTRAGRKAAAEAKRLETQRAAATPKADKRPTAAKATPRRKPLETRLAANLAGLGTMVAVTGGMLSPAFQADGVLIVEQSADLAKALAKVADDQPAVAAALERMLTAGVYSALAAALLPLVLGIAANHGVLPPSIVQMLSAVPAPGADDD